MNETSGLDDSKVTAKFRLRMDELLFSERKRCSCDLSMTSAKFRFDVKGCQDAQRIKRLSRMRCVL